MYECCVYEIETWVPYGSHIEYFTHIGRSWDPCRYIFPSKQAQMGPMWAVSGQAHGQLPIRGPFRSHIEYFAHNRALMGPM